MVMERLEKKISKIFQVKRNMFELLTEIIRKNPLSHDTVQWYWSENIDKCPYFTLQCDESTDDSQCARQLLVFIRFLNDNKTFKDELLFSLEET